LLTATQSIRQTTQHLHSELEGTAIAKDLMSSQLTLTRYAHILGVWAEVWAALEKEVWSSVWASQISRLLPERRAGKARQDIDDVIALLKIKGIETGAASHSWKDLEAPASASAPELVGHCYVMQGSSLGGKVIARHLGETLGLHSEQGRSFFMHSGTAPLTWTQWCREADVRLATTNDRQEALKGASNAFTFLIQAFSRVTV